MITLGIILAADILIGLLIEKFIMHVLQYDQSPFKTWWGRCLAVVFAPPRAILYVFRVLAVWIFYAISDKIYRNNQKYRHHHPD